MIIRTYKDGTQLFTRIYNSALSDTSISWQAKGLLCYLLSRPDNWRAVLEHLRKLGPDGEFATRSALRELIDAGYLRKIRVSDPGKGTLFWDHIVFEDKRMSAAIRNDSSMTQAEYDSLQADC